MREYTFNVYRNGQFVKKETAKHHRKVKNTFIFSRDADLKSGDEIVDIETDCRYKVVSLLVKNGFDGKEVLLVDLKNI